MLFRSKTRLDKVLGLNGETAAPKTTIEQMKAQPKKTVSDDSPPWDAPEDDDMAYFSKLAEE